MAPGRFIAHLTRMAVAFAALLAPGPAVTAAAVRGGGAERSHVIVFVWDGLRPDGITAADTPNLLALARSGVTFTDNHATYPTFTMMNAATLATGSFPGTAGFYGNVTYRPDAVGRLGNGRMADFSRPISTEDYGVLDGLGASYGGRLLEVPTLFQTAQRAGLVTVAVGKSGPAYLQDHTRGGIIVDERMAWPLEIAKRLQTAGFALPRTSTLAYPPGALELAADNGDPTAPTRSVARLSDGVTPDPTDAGGSPFAAPNRYLMHVFTAYLLPRERPDLSVVWLRNPDSTEHAYGVGTPDARDALRDQDELLGVLEEAMRTYGLASTTDLIVMSDHAHSTVAGPASLFPPRTITAKEVGAVSQTEGFSVSGDVRLADLLTRAGFLAYDGGGCGDDPVLSGITADGGRVYASRTDDGTECGCAWAGKAFTTGSFRIPRGEAPRHGLIVAVNGGSDYVYVPDHDAGTVARLVRFLQSREEVGAIFVADRYRELPGTLPLGAIRAEDREGRDPDVILSYTFDENAVVAGVRGAEFEGTDGEGGRGMHGSFSPVDVHNVLIAYGPHFRSRFTDTLPTGNVDVAPTVARILGLELPHADGRPLLEALTGGVPQADYEVEVRTLDSNVATNLRMLLPTSPSGADVDAASSTYRIRLHTKVVRLGSRRFTYFDSARAIRK